MTTTTGPTVTADGMGGYDVRVGDALLGRVYAVRTSFRAATYTTWRAAGVSAEWRAAGRDREVFDTRRDAVAALAGAK